MTRPELDPTALWLWLRGIRFQPDSTFPNSAGQHISDGLRRRAAEWYAGRYYAEHGRLPEGTHRVKVTFDRRDKDEGRDLKQPMPWVGGRILDTDICFPPAEAYQADPEPQG